MNIDELVIDKENKIKFQKYKWHVVKAHNKQYLASTLKKSIEPECKYMTKKSGQRIIYAHWLALGYFGNESIDHINGNGLDNRKENLRIVSHAKNMQNRKLNTNSTTGEKNIYKSKNRYTVDVIRNKKRYRKNGFHTLSEAIIYRDNLLSKL